MAYRFDNDADDIGRGSTLPSAATFTWMGWINWEADDELFNCIFEYGTIAGNFVVVVIDGGNGTGNGNNALVHGVTGNPAVGGSILTPGTWYHIAVTKSGANHVVYLDGVSNISYSFAVTPDTVIIFGNNDIGEGFNGRIGAIKMWSGAALSAAEIQNEMRQYLPVRRLNLYGFWPGIALDEYADLSGGGNTLSEAGTVTIEDGPPIPWKSGRQRILIPAAAAPGGRIFKLAGTGGGLIGPSRGLVAMPTLKEVSYYGSHCE